MGETHEEGGHILDMFALGNLYKKKHSKRSAFFVLSDTEFVYNLGKDAIFGWMTRKKNSQGS